MGTSPRASVDGPSAAPPRLGLVAQAPTIIGNDQRWQGGYAYLPESCGAATGTADPCESAARTVQRADANPDVVAVEPFVVWAADTCTALAAGGRDFEGRAKRLLNASQSKQVEAEFWSGAQSIESGFNNPRLANDEDSNVVNLTDAAVSPTEALGCLEQGLADCMAGGRGMIHATMATVTHWVALNLVRREGNQLLTYLDTIVVPGAGYDGSGPLNNNPAVDDSAWAYATEMVQVRLGDVDVSSRIDGFDNDMQNTITVFAQRLAAVDWSGCCHLAAEVIVPLCGISGS